MQRLLISALLALGALVALATSAHAATAPSITSVSPSQVRVGDKLVINGRNFRKGIRNNRVFFSRASDGKTVRTRPSKASSSRRMEVIVPAGVDRFLAVRDGAKTATRFQIQVLSGSFSRKTSRRRSPIILPATATVDPNTGQPVTTPPPPPDCDADGTPDATDADDDNDGLTDELENVIKTGVCNKDTDGDGIEDGYEYHSARDLNSNAVPYPGKRPFPNPLDPSDPDKDYDGDGMTTKEEFGAWNQYGGRALPTGDGQTFPYSNGSQVTPAASNAGGGDYDQNGKVTDDEKDADNDGVANWVEMAKDETWGPFWTQPNGTACTPFANTGPNAGKWSSIFSDCGAGPVPNGTTFQPIDGYPWNIFLNYLDPDTDGDTINDAADDQDHDRLSNAEEVSAGGDGWYTDPQDPCDPNLESDACPQHTVPSGSRIASSSGG